MDVSNFGKEVRIIDYYEAHGHGLEHYVKVLQDRGYKYGKSIGYRTMKNQRTWHWANLVETLTRLEQMLTLFQGWKLQTGLTRFDNLPIVGLVQK